MADHHRLGDMSRLCREVRILKRLNCKFNACNEFRKQDLNEHVRVCALDHIILLGGLIGFDSFAIQHGRLYSVLHLKTALKDESLGVDLMPFLIPILAQGLLGTDQWLSSAA